MKKQLLSGLVAAAVLGTLALPVSAQNVAIVNGKAVPKERVEALKQQVERSGRPVTPDIEGQIKEEVIAREIFMQEAQKRGLETSADYKSQLELARQAIPAILVTHDREDCPPTGRCLTMERWQ